MSAPNYKVELVVDDTALKDLERRMGAIFSPKGSGGGGSSNNSSPLKNLLKLGTIALGVGTLVGSVKKILDLTIDASPMLKGMLGLFGNTVMFILRPIGDFFGYLLKPIMIYLLRYVAIPFYKHYAPFMQKYGTLIGNFIVAGIKFFLNPAGYVTGAVSGAASAAGAGAQQLIIQGAQQLSTAIKPLLDGLTNVGTAWTSISKWFTGIGNDIKNTFTDSWNMLTAWFTGIGVGLKPLVTAWDQLWAWFNSIGNGLKPLVNAWDTLSSWFTGIGSGLKPLVTAWDMLWSWFNGIGSGIKPLVTAWDQLWAWFSKIGGDITNTFVKAWDMLTGFWTDILNFLKDPWGTLGKIITGQSPTTSNPTPSSQSPSITIQIDKAYGDVSKWGSDLEQTILSAIQKSTAKGAHS